MDLQDSTSAAISTIPRSGLDWFSKNLIDALPAAVYVCDIDGVVQAFNEKAAEIWARRPKVGDTEELYCGAHRLYYPDGTFLLHRDTPMAECLRTGIGVTAHDVVIGRPDGSRVPVAVSIAPIHDDAGERIGAVNCFVDMTNQRAAEAERAALMEALNQSKKLEAIGRLTGGITHDFNNILAGMMGALDILQRRVAREERDDLASLVNVALDAAQRATQLTRRLLTFARQQPLVATAVNVNEMLDALRPLLQHTVGSAINVRFHRAPDLWPTLVDASQLENAVLNLCANSRDAMPDGGQLTITTSNVTFIADAINPANAAPGDYVSIEVHDNGIGMTKEVADHAFEPFYTTKRDGAGTGLGLAMLYGFVGQSGGYTRLETTLRIGTSVTIYLPRCEQGALLSTPTSNWPQ